MKIASTLIGFINTQDPKRFWRFLEKLFLLEEPVCAEHAVIRYHYRNIYRAYKYLRLDHSQWLACGAEKHAFLVMIPQSQIGHCLGKVEWKPRFPLVVKLYSNLQKLENEQNAFNAIINSRYHDCVLPHKFFDDFSVSPYAPERLCCGLGDSMGSRLPKHLIDWHNRSFWFERSRRYGDSKKNKHFYKLKSTHHFSFNICVYKGYPRYLDLGDIYGLPLNDK